MNRQNKTLKLVVNGGTVTGIYSDELIPLIEQAAAVETKRASHVEPLGKGWTADLSPVGGPVLGPFTSRQQALDAEVEYLTSNVVN